MKQYAKGIYIKKFQGQYGEWLSVSIKTGDEQYDRYKFYPCREQKNDKYIEFYGVVDDWKPTQKQDENIVNFDDEEIPF